MYWIPDAEFDDIETAGIEFGGHKTRIEGQVLALVPKYCLSEKLTKQLRNLESQQLQEGRDLKADVTLAYQEVAANIMAFNFTCPEWALVLFDIDGFTTVVSTKKLIYESEELAKGTQCFCKWGKENLKVEVIEISASVPHLDHYEDQWQSSHRSIALDREKKRRGARACGGYLDVWPTDMEEVSQHHSSDEEEHLNEAVDNVDQQASTKPKRKRTKESAKEKLGTNGRKIVVHYEGSGDFLSEQAVPGRQPFHTDHLTEDQIDVVEQQTKDHRLGKKTTSTLTDTVVILGEDDAMPCLQRKKETLDKSTWTEGLTQGKLDRILELLEQVVTTTSAIRDNSIPSLQANLNKINGRVSLSDILSFNLTADPVVEPSTSRTDEAHPVMYMTEVDAADDMDDDFQVLGPLPPLTPDRAQDTATPVLPVVSTPAEPVYLATPARASGYDLLYPMKKAVMHYPCRKGPVVEITSSLCTSSVPADAEVRVKTCVQRAAKSHSCSDKNYGWVLVQTLFSVEEMRDRNFYGKKGRLPLSPRRVHAIEHAIIDMLGDSAISMRSCVNSINTGMRNMQLRPAPKRLPFVSVENFP
ncbi:uncharacterized protein LOC110461112 [Mizuhopecten yessoensis]|uniref:uncharacterized protein LOC110461112 n=1 Tax=Mizuhopecten yessoensis TaxID=6573 RepID=UPI000B45D81A|nr:uncharacterized protein LOC110461112 [Mizuhopecten yessoensis]